MIKTVPGPTPVIFVPEILATVLRGEVKVHFPLEFEVGGTISLVSPTEIDIDEKVPRVGVVPKILTLNEVDAADQESTAA